MTTKNSIFRLTGKVQHYQWGGYTYIPQLLGMDNSAHQPYAEYWLGAHDNAPAHLEGGWALNALIRETPAYLGEKVQNAFGRLPYLLKILDVKDMLSIQVHPNKKAAVIEFEKENQRGVPLHAADRNYKDDNHKPELMTALSSFWLLHGFQPQDRLRTTLAAVPELAFLLPIFGTGEYKALYEKVMKMDQPEVNRVLQPLLDRIIPLYKNEKLDKNGPDFWAARAALTFNEKGNVDRGIFSVYFFNVVYLKKGEAVFQDAGILHAYLEGQNVEIMANSDNVLRGGLTPKHIDVEELLKHVVFESVEPHIILGKTVSDAEQVFKTPAKDFELSRITLATDHTCQLTIKTADIFLVLDGWIEVNVGSGSYGFKKGEAFLAVNNASISIKAQAATEMYRASVPVDSL